MSRPTAKFHRDVDNARRQIMLKYLQAAQWNISRAAKLAEIDRKQFRRWMGIYGIATRARRELAL